MRIGRKDVIIILCVILVLLCVILFWPQLYRRKSSTEVCTECAQKTTSLLEREIYKIDIDIKRMEGYLLFEKREQNKMQKKLSILSTRARFIQNDQAIWWRKWLLKNT